MPAKTLDGVAATDDIRRDRHDTAFFNVSTDGADAVICHG